MKRYKIVNRKRFTAFLSIVILACIMITGSAMGFFTASSKDVTKYTTIQVQAGDTLWNLAKVYGNDHKDIREVIYDICKLNNVSAESLKAGQYITIPN